jgi:16S rRNA processing protein RimM
MKGEVVTVPVDGLPFLMQKGLEVCLVPPSLHVPRYRTVRAVEDGRRGQLVAFEGVSGLDDAEKLAGKYVLAREADLDWDGAGADARALVGLSVVDEKYGELGEVAEVMLGSVQDVLVVEGAYGEVLVPVVDAFVLSVSEDGVISTRVPNGLVEGA